MQELAFKRLKEFWRSCWLDTDEVTTGMISIELYLPDPLIETLINCLLTLYMLPILQSHVHDSKIDHKNACTILALFMAQNSYVTDRSHELLQILIDLHHDFNKICERKREEAKAKRALKAELCQTHIENEGWGWGWRTWQIGK